VARSCPAPPNVRKTNGYNLEHNFGHGTKTLASVLVTLNLRAFAFHTDAYLGVIAWRAAVIARFHSDMPSAIGEIWPAIDWLRERYPQIDFYAPPQRRPFADA
jgi:hypothetical protein